MMLFLPESPKSFPKTKDHPEVLQEVLLDTLLHNLTLLHLPHTDPHPEEVVVEVETEVESKLDNQNVPNVLLNSTSEVVVVDPEVVVVVDTLEVAQVDTNKLYTSFIPP